MNPLRLFIIDDEAIMRRVLSRATAPISAATVEASSYQEAVKVFEPSKFDVAFVDVNLGCDNGIDLAGRLKNLDPGLRVIVMSGDPANEEKVKEAGLGQMLPKPFSMEELQGRLKVAAGWAA